MSEAQQSSEQAQIPPMPDIKDTAKLGPWMKQVIQKPPQGYDLLKHPNGTPFSVEEQIDTYIQQTIDVIKSSKARNAPDSRYKPLEEYLLRIAQPPEST